MHDRSESRALRLLGHLPVAHAPELFVRDALNQIGHCSQPEVATMAKHSRENGADLFAIPFALLRRRQKMVNALLRTMPSWSDCSNELTRQPAPLESNAVQPMHQHVGGARLRSARRLGYDGGGDLNPCAGEADWSDAHVDAETWYFGRFLNGRSP